MEKKQESSSDISSDHGDEEDKEAELFNHVFGPDFQPSPLPPEVHTDIDMSYKNKAYWSLPENVRNAIDIAKQKSKYSEFYHKLNTLNEKIFVFRTVFYGRLPSFQRKFIEKKKKMLEQQLQK